MHKRREKLQQVQRVQQFYRELEDEKPWIREQEPSAQSTNYGRDLIGVQNLVKKHQALMTELAGHEARIRRTLNSGEDMVQREHYATPDIKQRISQLQAKWDLLKEKALKRKHDLDDALQAQQYFTDANEVDAWIKEKEPQVSSTDYGKDEDSVEVINYLSL